MTTSNAGHTNRRPRGGRGRFVASPDTAERDAAACRLRTQGLSYDAIATRLDYGDRSTARRAVERALRAIVFEPAAELRALELARLDAATAVAWDVMVRDHVAVSNGRVVLHPETGLPLLDDAPKLAAIAQLVRLSERRSRLCGLDAPTRVEAITVDQVEAEINRLAAEMGLGASGGRELEAGR